MTPVKDIKNNESERDVSSNVTKTGWLTSQELQKN